MAILSLHGKYTRPDDKEIAASEKTSILNADALQQKQKMSSLLNIQVLNSLSYWVSVPLKLYLMKF